MSGHGPTEQSFLLRLLKTSPVFDAGGDEALRQLVTAASPITYPSGTFLFRQGEPAAHVFMITAGEVAIVSPARGGAEQVHSIVGPGELFGELALLTNGRRTAGARATSATTAWAIAREAFWAFLEATPAASSALLRLVARRLAAREALIDDLLSLDVKGRLAKALLQLAERHGRQDPSSGAIVIAVRLTHRDLAGMVGASRENVTRALANFRKRRFVDYDADAIRLLDLPALRRLT
jgi:CRP/FNR family transcriptional regulator, cyclic AMP receptor protein